MPTFKNSIKQFNTKILIWRKSDVNQKNVLFESNLLESTNGIRWSVWDSAWDIAFPSKSLESSTSRQEVKTYLQQHQVQDRISKEICVAGGAKGRGFWE